MNNKAVKIRVLSITLLLSVLIVFPFQIVLGENQITEQQALNVLIAQIQKHKLYDSWTTLSCLSFLTEEKTRDYFGFAIHEKHEANCPGDPNTWPIVDRFRVNRFTKKIQWLEPIEGEWLSYGDVLKARLRK